MVENNRDKYYEQQYQHYLEMYRRDYPQYPEEDAKHYAKILADQSLEKKDAMSESDGSCWVLAALSNGLGKSREEYNKVVDDLHRALEKIGVSKEGFNIGGFLYSTLKTPERVSNLTEAAQNSNPKFANHYFTNKAVNGFHALLEMAGLLSSSLEAKNMAESIAPLRTNFLGKPLVSNLLTIEQKILRVFSRGRMRV